MTTTIQDFQERRICTRHPIRDSSAVMLSPDDIISFSILDISESGMSFSYNGRGLNSKLKDSAVLAFFGERVGASNIPVTIISDTEIDLKNVWIPEDMGGAAIPYLRRCGVEFGELSDMQKHAMNNYIQGLLEM